MRSPQPPWLDDEAGRPSLLSANIASYDIRPVNSCNHSLARQGRSKRSHASAFLDAPRSSAVLSSDVAVASARRRERTPLRYGEQLWRRRHAKRTRTLQQYSTADRGSGDTGEAERAARAPAELSPLRLVPLVAVDAGEAALDRQELARSAAAQSSDASHLPPPPPPRLSSADRTSRHSPTPFTEVKSRSPETDTPRLPFSALALS